jgi:hypothetical protein
MTEEAQGAAASAQEIARLSNSMTNASQNETGTNGEGRRQKGCPQE